MFDPHCYIDQQLCLNSFDVNANSKSPDQPAHLLIMWILLVICCLQQNCFDRVSGAYVSLVVHTYGVELNISF